LGSGDAWGSPARRGSNPAQLDHGHHLSRVDRNPALAWLARGFAFTTDKLSSFAHELNFLGSQNEQLLLFKALLLVLDFLGAFFNFSLAIRAFIHAGFAVEGAQASGDSTGTRVDARELERGALHYTLGMRCFYFSIPLAFWLFGPAWMFTGAIGLVVLLKQVD
jgi:uncharacterized membrane protein